MTTAIANWSQCIIEASVKSLTRILSFEDGEFLRSCDGATAIFKSVIGKDSHASLAFRKGPAQLMEGLFEVFDQALALSELEIIGKRGENLEQYEGERC